MRFLISFTKQSILILILDTAYGVFPTEWELLSSSQPRGSSPDDLQLQGKTDNPNLPINQPGLDRLAEIKKDHDRTPRLPKTGSRQDTLGEE